MYRMNGRVGLCGMSGVGIYYCFNFCSKNYCCSCACIFQLMIFNTSCVGMLVVVMFDSIKVIDVGFLGSEHRIGDAYLL